MPKGGIELWERGSIRVAGWGAGKSDEREWCVERRCRYGDPT